MKKTAKGSSYKGYQAVRTTTGTWSDYTGSKRPIEIFRTEIRTPYSLGLDDEGLKNKLKKDLSVVWEDISLFSKKECNERAYKLEKGDFKYELIGCTPIKDWDNDRYNILVITRNDFKGFPETVSEEVL